MALADLRELKPAYLDLIDLIRSHRIQELGKRGPTHIPKAEIDAIVPERKIGRLFQALIDDGVIGEPKKIKSKGKAQVVNIPCLKTAEEILAYRRSLIIQGALGLQVDSYKGAFYKMKRNGYEGEVELSDREGRLLTFLIEHANEPMQRDHVAAECELTTNQVSNILNSLRRKIGRLGFTAHEVDRMLSRYARGRLMFNRT